MNAPPSPEEIRRIIAFDPETMRPGVARIAIEALSVVTGEMVTFPKRPRILRRGHARSEV